MAPRSCPFQTSSAYRSTTALFTSAGVPALAPAVFTLASRSLAPNDCGSLGRSGVGRIGKFAYIRDLLGDLSSAFRGAHSTSELPRTPYARSSGNAPSTHSGEQGLVANVIVLM